MRDLRRKKGRMSQANALPSIEPLEARAMMAALAPESWTSTPSATAPLGSGALTSSGSLITCSSPASSSAGTTSLAAPTLSIGAAATGIATDGPALPAQPIGALGAQGTGPSFGSTSSGSDLWLSYGAASGSAASTSGSSGAVAENGPELSSQCPSDSGAVQAASAAGYGSCGLPSVFFQAPQTKDSGTRNPPGLTGSSTLALVDAHSDTKITPLAFQPGSADEPVFTSGVWTGDDEGWQVVQVAGEVDEPSEITPPSKQTRILDITEAAGMNPTDAQFWAAIRQVDEMVGGESEAALGEIMAIRDRGIDNPLLACLDHYYNARKAVEDCPLSGLMFAKVLIANAGYSLMKTLGFAVPQDTAHPPSPITIQQWMSGNFGAADGLLPRSHHE